MNPHQSLIQWSLDETERVTVRMRSQLEKTPAVVAFEILSGMVYHAGQKLIDRKRGGAPPRAVDEAVIIACSRLFNDCLAAYMLASRGLVLPAITLVRSAFEVVTQTVMFMEHPDLAASWLKGRRFAPKTVRARSKLAGANKAIYGRLSSIAHPNVDAVPFHVVPLAVTEGYAGGTALAYGGWYCPKLAGHVICQAVFAQLTMLEVFYQEYGPELTDAGLLWRGETVAAWKEIGIDVENLGFGWDALLGVFRRLLADAQAAFDSMPNDVDEVAKHIQQHASGEPRASL